MPIVGDKTIDRVAPAVQEIQREYAERGSGVQVIEIAEGWQMATRPEHARFVRQLYSEKMTMRLSTAALETLAIIAYKQPLTRAEVEEIRGVEVIAALETLLEKGLVRVVGRKESVGRPLLYGTTPEFLRQFGLRGVADLPPLDSFQPPPAPPSASGDGGAENGLPPPPPASSPDAVPAPAEAAPAPPAEAAPAVEEPLPPQAETGTPQP
jgi:segregation and condensation protein B